MSKKFETSILINLAGNLQAKAKQYGAAFDGMGKQAKRGFGTMQSAAGAAINGVDRLGNAYTGAASAFVTGTLIKGVADFDKIMTRLGTDAGLAITQVEKLKTDIMDVANNNDFNIDRSQLADAVGTFLGDTGDFETAEKNINTLALAMQGYGVNGETAGRLLSTMWKDGIKDADEMQTMLDMFFTHFDKGSLKVIDFSREMPALFGAMMNVTPEKMAQMSALAQVTTRKITSAPEMTTAIKAAFSTFRSSDKQQSIQKLGVKVYEDDGKTLRNEFDIITDLIEKTKSLGDKQAVALGRIFDDTAMNVITNLSKDANFEFYKNLTTAEVERGKTLDASRRNAEAFGAVLSGLKGQFETIASDSLSDPLKELSGWIGKVDADTAKWIARLTIGLASVVATVVLIKKLGDTAKTIKGWMPGGKKKGDNDSLGGTSLAATPVYVVNMPSGGFDGGSKNKGGGKNRKNKKGKQPYSPKQSPAKPNIPNAGNAPASGGSRWSGSGGVFAKMTGIGFALEASDAAAKLATDAIDKTALGQSLLNNKAQMESSDFGEAVNVNFMDAVSDVIRYFQEDSANNSQAGQAASTQQLAGKVEVEVTDKRALIRSAHFGADVETIFHNGPTMSVVGG